MYSKLVIPLTNLEFQKWEEKKNQHNVKKDKKRVFSKWWGLILPCLPKQRTIDVPVETLTPNPQWDQDRTDQGSEQEQQPYCTKFRDSRV